MRNAGRIYEELLVQQAQAGDRVAMDHLAELRGPRLLIHAARLLGDADAARDVVQDAWIEILRGLPGLREPRAFASWATRIATRRVARYIKGRVSDRAVAKMLVQESEATEPEAGPAASDARAVRAAIATLPPEQAATIALFYLEDMSVAEVAIALDIPRGTVKTRLMHARDKLKSALKGEDDA
ncbi:RNA polymerase sigma factor [Roseovarius aestuarii]|uniref:ECF RNA polymerase sigma factor SigW n=1 Tax=Roseovarius aestuarii TaxID=475083 RepID=A0A1X7BRT2_9RHOB|nr:RNA polymerase sigma factor [Roseovarius aestuarii]SMC12362.1 ECF RNA polymerase sigma factor SigW [Roseovarius aestuarii]